MWTKWYVTFFIALSSLLYPQPGSSNLDISLVLFDLEAVSNTRMHAPSAASLPLHLCLHGLQTFFADVVLVNLYYAWYDDYGHLELIGDLLSNELQHWYDTRKKPIIVSEYGADSVIGLHVVGCMCELFMCLWLCMCLCMCGGEGQVCVCMCVHL